MASICALGHEIKPEQRITQMIKHTQKQHEVEPLRPAREIVNLPLPHLDAIAESKLRDRPARLP